MSRRDGTAGWDAYAPFYDWENARTLGRRDVAFWRTLALETGGPALELGCGTGRLLLPIARRGVTIAGVDRSADMLTRARRRARSVPRVSRPRLVQGDVRALPFRPRSFATVIAAYGMLQSILDDRDLDRAIAEAARVLRPGGVFGVDLVPDLLRWREYRDVPRLSGQTRAGTRLQLIESVRQDRRRGVTIFDERFIEQRGRRRSVREFSLTFRTVPLPQLAARLEAAGFVIEAALGGYDHRPWDDAADVWILLARRAGRRLQS